MIRKQRNNMSAIYRGGVKYTGTTTDAKALAYDNTQSGLDASTVQVAVDSMSQKLDEKLTVNGVLKGAIDFTISNGTLTITTKNAKS